MRDGKIFELVQNQHKISNIESFFRSKLLFSDISILNNYFYRQCYLSKVDFAKKMNIEIVNWFFRHISDQFIDTLVMFFYMGESLFVSCDEQLVFEEPISMKEWIDLIDPNWTCRKYGNKDNLISDIFKKCNEREQAILDAQTDLIMDNFDKFDEFMPVYAFRKLYFYRFSNEMVNELVRKIHNAKFMQIVPKRWRGSKKIQAIRNNWVCMRNNEYKKYDYYYGPDRKVDKNTTFDQIGKECVDDFYDMIESEYSDDDQDSPTNQIEFGFAYDLPRRLNPESVDKDDIDMMEGELFKFLTDEEAIAKAIEIDKNYSMSLHQKLRELNKIGYSRTGEESRQVYLLVPPGHQLNQNYSSMMKCEDFFVPNMDRKLPRIVLMSLIVDSDSEESD